MILKLAFKVQSSYSFWVPEYHAKKIKTVGKKQKKKKKLNKAEENRQ